MYGGTGITNFSADQLEHYKEAIRIHGDKDIVVILEPMTYTGYEGLYSLHHLKYPKKQSRDFSMDSFWKVFNSIRPQFEKVKP